MPDPPDTLTLIHAAIEGDEKLSDEMKAGLFELVKSAYKNLTNNENSVVK